MSQTYPTNAAELAALIAETAEGQPATPETALRFVAYQNALHMDASDITELLLRGNAPMSEQGVSDWLANLVEMEGSDAGPFLVELVEEWLA